VVCTACKAKRAVILMKEKTETNNRPIQKLQIGNISVAIWENEASDGKKFPTVSLSRSYKQGAEWKNSSSFRVSDLLKASLALQKAYELLAVREQPNHS